MTSNNQGELSPLEIGIHALKAVPKAEGGRGKKGGLSAYAAKVGKPRATIDDNKKAAEVFLSITENLPHVRQVLSDPASPKNRHQTAIWKLPRKCWQAACEWLAANDASVADVEAKVKAAAEVYGNCKDIFTVSDHCESVASGTALRLHLSATNGTKLHRIARVSRAGRLKPPVPPVWQPQNRLYRVGRQGRDISPAWKSGASERIYDSGSKPHRSRTGRSPQAAVGTSHDFGSQSDRSRRCRSSGDQPARISAVMRRIS